MSLILQKTKISIGSRQSDLARLQALTVGTLLLESVPDLEIRYFSRPSYGDLNLDMNLKETNSKGVFTQEFKDLLKNKDCDLVVHSWKDLPIEDDPETEILTLSHREDQRDLLFLKKSSLSLYPKSNLTILTSSPRREFSLKNKLKDFLPFKMDSLNFEPIRGNIPTRFKKFLESKADGFVVAKAAVDRLMSSEKTNLSEEFKAIRLQILEVFQSCHFMVLPLSEFPTAAAQGALAIEILKDHAFKEKLKLIADENNFTLVEMERKTHKKYGGGCHQAMGFSAIATDHGIVFNTSGEYSTETKNESFHTQNFYPTKILKKTYKKDQLFSQSVLKTERQKKIFFFKDLKNSNHSISDTDFNPKPKSEFVISRFEARLEDLKNKDYTVWVSGSKTWKALAREGYWINGSLDGLGLGHKPDMNYLCPPDFFWLTNSGSSPKNLKNTNPNKMAGFKIISTYDLNYVFDSCLNKEDLKTMLKDIECFFWMSGHGFESMLNECPEMKSKIHFCGLGRSIETLRKHLNENQIYFCLNEDDFVQKCTGSSS